MPSVVGIDHSIKKRKTCGHCGAVNEYVPADVRNIWSGKDYGGGSAGADGFNCAGCGKEVYTRTW